MIVENSCLPVFSSVKVDKDKREVTWDCDTLGFHKSKYESEEELKKFLEELKEKDVNRFRSADEK